jgi:hypothetical protein
LFRGNPRRLQIDFPPTHRDLVFAERLCDSVALWLLLCGSVAAFSVAP